uniref:LRRNT domain-containing protein n=1 Tax=Photinus pyralis TaxID=7054 RepID=A0A1Y1KHC6_PHOPY
MMAQKWLICFFIALSASQKAEKPAMSCSYGGRGTLISICTNANAGYFRKTSYRFDHLDETLRCVNCSLQVLEGGSLDLSGNQIKHLDLHNSQITVLKPRAFIGLIFLETLNINSNLIAVIPPETFQGVTKIRTIDASNNVIKSLAAKAFVGLSNLISLNLCDNKIGYIDTDAFSGLDSLRVLELCNNAIYDLHHIFTAPSKLWYLNVARNQITDVIETDFRYLNNLVVLRMPSNSLKSIRRHAFLPLLNLQTLNLSSNPIEAIETGGFRGLSSLEEFDLSGCRIRNVQKGLLLALHMLRTLDLSNNRLGTFQTGIFSGLPELRVLNVSHNKIKRYERTGVLKLPSLHNLDLSYNELKTIDYKALIGHLPALSYLGLEGNDLSCFLKSEMQEMFKEDNFKFNLGAIENSNEKCNASKIDVDTSSNQIEDVSTERLQSYKYYAADEHEYFLYVFIVFSVAVLSILFYLHYRDRVQLARMSHTDTFETPLIVN